MYHTYILKLEDDSYYSGSTKNLKQRLKNHNQGNVDATRNLLPAKLVWCATFKNRKLATDFEKYLKRASGIAFRNKRLI